MRRGSLLCSLRAQGLCVGQTPSYTRTDLTTLIGTQRVAIADFNHDGKPDIAYLVSGTLVSILLGQGNGAFFVPITTTLATASAANIMAVGDLNNDGFPDVITFDYDNDTIYILIGNGDGTFQTPRTIHNSSANGFAIGDFNGDGKADFAATSFSGSVVIYLGNGDGTFSRGAPISAGGNGSNAVIAGDLNRDGKLDLAVANMDSNNVSVMYGNGDGTFSPAALYPLDAGSAPQALAWGDVNGDGIPDIVVAETSNFAVAVLLGNSSGSFTNIGTFPTNRYVYDLALADLNGDGKLDIVAATNYGTTNTSFVTVLLGSVNGTFGTAVDFAAAPASQSVAVGDLNGDGVPDIVEAGWAATDITVLTSGTAPVSVTPFFTLSKSHTGNFTQGQLGATFMISIENPATVPTNGPVTVTDQLPAGLTLVSMLGTGWMCSSDSCSRSDSLSPGSSYPPITVTVNVLSSAGSPLVNIATAANGGSVTTANDTVNLTTAGPPAPVLTSPPNGAAGASVTLTLSWSSSSGATSYDVYFGTSSTPPLVTNTTSTTYVPATLTANSTYYWRVVAKDGAGTTSSLLFSFTTFNPSCTFTVSPRGGLISYTGGTASLLINTASGCSWVAISASPWLSVTFSSPGSGNGIVNVSANANTGIAQLGYINLASTTIGVMQGGSPSAQIFNDVPSTDPYFDYVSLMSSYGITVGCQTSPPLYCPSEPVTRAEMAVFIVRGLDLATGASLTYPTTPDFQDVPPSGVTDSEYFDYVQRLAQLGITVGCQTTPALYCPDESIPQNEMAVFVIRAWMLANNITTLTYPATPLFSDVPATDEYFPYIQKMGQMGFWTGCGGGQYCENVPVTRDQMAPMILRGMLGAP